VSRDEWTDEEPGADDWFAEDEYEQELYEQDQYDQDQYGADQYDEVDWIDVREPMGAGRRILLALGAIVAVVAVAGAALYFWVQGQIDPSGEPGPEVEVEIAAGSTTEDIGKVLDDRGVISSATIWDYWTRFNDEGPFQAGFFVFRENSSFSEAVDVLEAGPRPPDLESVTVPEGLTVGQIVTRITDPDDGIERWDAAAVQAAIDSPEIRSRYQPAEVSSMEGMLFPDTYEIDDETDERTFVRRLVTELDSNLEELDVEARAAELGISPYQVVVVASLIEEEARVPEDRARIARVIYNRLQQGIPLGIDATSRYEAEVQGRGRDDIDFDSDSPYNTRRVAGLPPTPIASAGRASLEAALNPEPGGWIYYVLADADGRHVFLETASEFQEAKQECIRLDLGCG
jgi:UPF0755 protein